MCFSNVSKPEVFLVDSLAVGQKIDGGADERVVLFVKLAQGQTLSNELVQKIKAEIRARRSPRHVPARVSFHRVMPIVVLAHSRPTDYPGARHSLHSEREACGSPSQEGEF
jgi:hypothetical protein